MARDRIGGYLVAALGGALAMVVVGGGLLAAHGFAAPGSPATTPVPSPSPAASAAIGQAEAAKVLPAFQAVGSATAPVTVQVWADYQCPYCALFAHGMEPSVLRDYVLAGTARIEYHDYAFLGAESTTAAVAARCSGAQGSFWPFHDVLFASQQGENQGTFSDALMLQVAKYLKLDETAFSACVKDPAVATAVEASHNEGIKLGIAGTPSVRLVGPGGVHVFSALPQIPDLLSAIDRLARGLPAVEASPSPSASGAPSPGTSPAQSPVPGATATPAASVAVPAASAP